MHTFKKSFRRHIPIKIVNVKLVDCFCKSGSISDKKQTGRPCLLNEKVIDVK
jgi:hypothetical protein